MLNWTGISFLLLSKCAFVNVSEYCLVWINLIFTFCNTFWCICFHLIYLYVLILQLFSWQFFMISANGVYFLSPWNKRWLLSVHPFFSTKLCTVLLPFLLTTFIVCTLCRKSLSLRDSLNHLQDYSIMYLIETKLSYDEKQCHWTKYNARTTNSTLRRKCRVLMTMALVKY